MSPYTFLQTILIAAWCVCASAQLQRDRPVGDLEVVLSLNEGPMPTGVTVSHAGRVFLNFPQWGDRPEVAVAEWVSGKLVPYRIGFENGPGPKPENRLVGVQSVVVDQQDHLWIVDTGSYEFGPSEYGGPKLVEVDLKTNKAIRTILFPVAVAPATSFLNDVCFDFHHGKSGFALLTDTSAMSNAIVIVDLASGKSWRHLKDDPSTKAEPNYQPYVEGEALLMRPKDGPSSQIRFGSDGIALSPDYVYLYYCPLIGRHLHRVPLAMLENPTSSEEALSAAVENLGDKGMSDGLETDSLGRIYGGDIETNSIRRRLPDGSFELVAHDPRILWPDTLSVASDGYLYFTSNQLHRQALFHGGTDQRQHPYVVFRTKIDATPIR